ncbi:MAG: T9SS type A sorting domain-containing protein [Flavobacteriales bacterium]|nr:T9SS type A sorting domain-containing protein [Flavobacteriales bacterium]MCB9197791.1 T9SS type A sorting domain-containing protein [Flavobacteriales bacterium]
MKPINLLLFTAFTFASIKNNAQITITSADMPQIGDIFIYENSQDILTEDFSLTGTNYSWDYSSATSSQVDSVFVVSVGSTPLAYQFYFNNQWTEPAHFSDYAQPGQDLNAQGQVTIEDRYDFFGINSNSLEIKGFGAKINGVPASVKYDTIDQIYPFPMTDGMAAHNSVGYYLASVPNLGTYGQWIRREVTVDGYGSLTTPNATYPNTIRVKTVLLQTDTVYVDQFMFGQTFDRPDETIYEWFTNTEKSPVMRVVYRNSQATEAKYMLEITSGTEEIEELDVSLVTEDIEGIYRLTNLESTFRVSVCNVNGQNIGSFPASKIDITDQPSGIYLVIIHTAQKNHCFKVVK